MLFIRIKSNVLYSTASSCSALPQIENGMVGVGDASNGSLAVYTCNEGYNIAGVIVRYCINGSWTGEEPICTITSWSLLIKYNI